MHGAAIREVTQRRSIERHSNGQAWRRHIRRHAPAPCTVPPFVKQRVYNMYHHVADLSLPYDLWNEEAELAVIAHLLGRHEKGTAARIYVETVQAYNAFNRRFEPVVREFSERDAFAKVWRVAAIREQLPAGASDAMVFAAVLQHLERGNTL